jgi:hypothetical protein
MFFELKTEQQLRPPVGFEREGMQTGSLRYFLKGGAKPAPLHPANATEPPRPLPAINCPPTKRLAFTAS